MATSGGPDFEQFRDILDDLARTAPQPPDVHWGRYQAELSERLAVRRKRRRAWWWRPLPLAFAAGLGGLLLFVAVQRWEQRGTGSDLTAAEERMIGGRLELLQRYGVVERLDLLEEFDVISHLDRLGGQAG